MRYRATFLAGFAVGFLAGARAGRERYEQIMKLSRKAAGSPAVQQARQTITVKATELTKTAASRVPKLVESARNKAGNRFDHFPGMHHDEHASVNGARTTADGS
jgi:hypothetical protein